METHGQDVDVIIDATDNFETRQLINDFAYKHRVPWIYGGVVQSWSCLPVERWMDDNIEGNIATKG